MSVAFNLQSRIALSPGYRLQWEEVQKAHVLLFPEGLIKLNVSAGEILKRCDGSATVADITAELEAVFCKSGLSDEVISFIGLALEKQWLQVRS